MSRRTDEPSSGSLAMPIPEGGIAPIASAPVEKLSLGTKLGYGVGDVGGALSYSAISVFLLFYLVQVVGLPPEWAGIVVMSGRVIDAITDPIMGVISDRTRTRWGRRRPYILVGAVPFGLTFALLWMMPEGSNGTIFALACGAIILHTLVFTMTSIPFLALTPELASDYDERTSLTSYRTGFAVLATLIAFAAPAALSAAFNKAAGLPETAREGWSQMGMVLGGLMVVTWLTSALSVRERRSPNETSTGSRSIVKEYLSALKVHGYLPTLLLFLVVTIGVGIVSAILPFYTLSVGGLDANQQSLVLGLCFGLSAVSLPVWTAVGSRFGKKRAFMVGIVVYVLGLIALGFIRPNGVVTAPLLISCSISGLGTGAVMLFPWAMVPDVLEFDELETGQRREGVFYSLFSFVQKLAYALGVFVTSQVLSLSGYVRGAVQQSETAIVAIQLSLSALTPIVLFVGFILVARYPITRESHAEALAELARRRATGQPPLEPGV